jgi:hypothetical protein
MAAARYVHRVLARNPGLRLRPQLLTHPNVSLFGHVTLSVDTGVVRFLLLGKLLGIVPEVLLLWTEYQVRLLIVYPYRVQRCKEVSEDMKYGRKCDRAVLHCDHSMQSRVA